MRVYITHGFEAYPEKHWFFWLKNELARRNIQTFIPSLPNASDPKLEEWLGCLEKECKSMDENTYFIAHSLGCITTLRFLQNKNLKIGGYILVCGFDKSLKNLPQLDSFTDVKLDYKKLINLSRNRLVICARDDSIVSAQLSFDLACNLQATFIQTNSGNHFMQDDGFKNFPLLLHELNFFLNK